MIDYMPTPAYLTAHRWAAVARGAGVLADLA